jgi:hypothetical protein
VVSARRGLVVDGVATLNGVGILYRSMLLPLSEDGVTIDHLLGAVSYRALRSNEGRPTQVNFRRYRSCHREQQSPSDGRGEIRTQGYWGDHIEPRGGHDTVANLQPDRLRPLKAGFIAGLMNS